MSIKHIAITKNGVSVNGLETKDPKEIGEAFLYNLHRSKLVLSDINVITDLIKLKEDFDSVSNWLSDQEMMCLPVADIEKRPLVKNYSFFDRFVDMVCFIKYIRESEKMHKNNSESNE